MIVTRNSSVPCQEALGVTLTVKSSGRAPRIKTLNSQIMDAAKKSRIKVGLISSEQVRNVFAVDESGTEYGRAKIIAELFPDELGLRLPPKRRTQDTEDARMDIFDAAALGRTYFKSVAGNQR